MSWLERCLTRCTFIPPDTMDIQQTYVPHKPHKPRKPKTYKYREYPRPLRLRDIQCFQSYTDNTTMILTPKCEGKSPHEHRFTCSNHSVSPHCSSCFEKGKVNHELLALCKDCDYTLCKHCYNSIVSPYLSEIFC